MLLPKPGAGGAGNTGGTGPGSGGAATTTCDPLTYPARPEVPDAAVGGDAEFVVVQSNVDLGDSTPNPSTPPTRYRAIGLDLDGICTTAANLTKGQSCVIPSFGSGVIDGPQGQDNALGQNIQLIRNQITQFSSDIYTTQLKKGVTNILVHVTGYNGLPNDDQVRVETLVSAPFNAFSRDPNVVPKWDGTDVWPIASDSVNGTRDKPKFASDAAYVTNGKMVLSLPTTALRLIVGLTPSAQVNLSLHLTDAIVVCDVLQTPVGHWGWTLKNCTLAARWLADDIIKQLSHFPDPATGYTRPLCTNSALYAGFKQDVCGLVDVSNSGFNTPTLDCDSLSMGVKFDTEPAYLGDVFAVPQVGELCTAAEGQPSLDNCESSGGGGTGAGGTTGAGGSASGGTAGAKDSGAGGTSADSGTADASSDASARD